MIDDEVEETVIEEDDLRVLEKRERGADTRDGGCLDDGQPHIYREEAAA